jgi:nicotinate-nucleotide pyrophosphorylase (carboxylating)
MNQEVKWIVNLALREDIGEGDITTKAVYSGTEHAEAEFIAKANGVIAGLELAKFIFSELDKDIRFNAELRDGDRVFRGQLIATASGPANTILTGERTVLNFMQRMSGIATRTRQFADAIAHTNAKILDTRKTAPGHRYLDKWAVRLGGGSNHRMRLDDRFLIKENHIATAGGIQQAINACLSLKEEEGLTAEIEIEVKNLAELDKVLEVGNVQYVMLDNMDLLDMQKAVKNVGGQFYLEASGNVTLDSVVPIAETGVDFISSGSLTHSVTALDISLLFGE